MPIAATIFDMDGLLIDSERIALRTFQSICDEHDLGEQSALYMQLLGTTDATSADILRRTLPTHIDVDVFMTSWTSLYAHETHSAVPLLHGVHELLDHLDRIDMPRAVATSTQTEAARHKLHNSGILHRFNQITGGDQVAQGKPAPDIYLLAAERLAVDPADCLALEDSPNGVRAALAAGMHVVQIPSLTPAETLKTSSNHTVLEDLIAVIAHLSRLQSH